MSQFQKNPFRRETTSRIVGQNRCLDEKQKLSQIRENMAKLKYDKLHDSNNRKVDSSALSFNDKVNNLKNINRY